MAVRLVVTFKTQAGQGGVCARAVRPVLGRVRGEEGCLQYDLFQSTEDPDRLVLLERWRDDASLEAHRDAMRAQGGIPRELLAEDPMLERYAVD